jgi:FtsP/CotA-like multicopper oxidase with cupredoxin domain
MDSIEMMMINRRNMLLTGLAGFALQPTLAASASTTGAASLTATTRTIDVNGRAAKVFALVGPTGKPGMELLLGQPFRAMLKNDTGTDTLIHWHGLTPPIEQDGTPVLSQAVLAQGASQLYDFVNTRSGTHWMHSHVGFQEQQLLAAPLIVRETTDPVFDEHEHVVMVHDFTFRDPFEILAELQAGGGSHAGHGQMDPSNMTGGTMVMGAMLNDVAYDAYLVNDRTLDDPEIVAVEKDGLVRLRIINAAAASNLWIDLGSLVGHLIAVDGNAVLPLQGSQFPLAIAQRADIRLRVPSDGGAFPIFLRPEGVATRSGLILATPGAAIDRQASAWDPAPALDLASEARLRAVAQLADEPVSRSVRVILTGGMDGYQWGLNGKPAMLDTIFGVKLGERVEVTVYNMTAMAHPMHLHGHYFKVTALNGTRIDGALRDTVLVPPRQAVSFEFDANNPGNWAFHCHHAYHMNSGMMGVFAYSSTA